MSVDLRQWQPWQRPYQHGVLVVLPSMPIAEDVDAWRARLDPVSYAHATAHITLTPPFRQRPTPDTIDSLAEMFASVNAFDVTVGPLRSFLPDPVLWLDVQPAHRLLALRQTLLGTELFQASDQEAGPFVPHLTITEGRSGEPVDQTLFDQLRDQMPSGSFRCQSVVHLLPNQEFCFEEHTRYLLSP